MAGSFFFCFRGAEQSFGVVGCEIFCAGLDSSPGGTLFWGKVFSIGQLVIDSSEFICLPYVSRDELLFFMVM